MKFKQIFPNLYSLWWGAFIYVIHDGGEITLIDVGMFGATKRILKATTSLGGSIRHILVTHADIDHVACLSEVVSVSGAKVYAGQLSATYLQKATPPPHVPPMMIPLIDSLGRFQKPVTPDHILQENEVLPMAGGIRIIATPGHTPDSLSFLWQEILFSGDLFKYRGGLRLNYPLLTHDAEAARASARKVLGMDITMICGGHDAPLRVADHQENIRAFLQSTR
jgi:glyoxylase-like metal-dependent hydrolase (beta-lactamase superfamily II)